MSVVCCQVDELITRPEESYRLCCVVVCDLETSRMGAPYIYDISRLRVNLYCGGFILFCSVWVCVGVGVCECVCVWGGGYNVCLCRFCNIWVFW